MADRLDFDVDVALETGLITGHAGVPGLIETFRQTGTAAVIDRQVKLNSRRRGLSASEVVESLLAMWAAGAVIGGLLFATSTTLMVVPHLFGMLRKGNDGKQAHGVFEEVPE
jgi:hypothetical protein